MFDRFPRKFDVQASYKPANYVLGPIFVVNIKFTRATYHTIVPSTEELYCLNRCVSLQMAGVKMDCIKLKKIIRPMFSSWSSVSCKIAENISFIMTDRSFLNGERYLSQFFN